MACKELKPMPFKAHTKDANTFIAFAIIGANLIYTQLKTHRGCSQRTDLEYLLLNDIIVQNTKYCISCLLHHEK